MDISFVGFDWDDGNLEKCGQHGVSRAEIESVFSGSAALLLSDAVHSESEERFIAIAQVRGGRHVFVAFTTRAAAEGVRIRPISARFMHKKEIEKYEQESSAPPLG